LLTNFVIPYYKKRALYIQVKNELNWPRIEKIEHFLTNLFRGASGKFTSKIYRYKHFIQDKEFVYGEIDFLSFYCILKKTEPKNAELFYDLGSGTGKAVFCAALFFNLSKSKGIELLQPLHDKADFFLKKAKNYYNEHLNDDEHMFLKQINTIELLHDNFLEYDFLDADIIYVAATCLNNVTWENLITKMAKLKPGSRIIVATKSIKHERFQIIYQSVELMSWGLCPIKIYKIVATPT
jgi:SAM-dependent methyltransferase